VLARRDSTVWGAAAEYLLHERLELRAELEGEDGHRPLAVIGMRYLLVPDQLQLKWTYGVRNGAQRERRTTLGVQVEF
jgi:hypothetical protein